MWWKTNHQLGLIKEKTRENILRKWCCKITVYDLIIYRKIKHFILSYVVSDYKKKLIIFYSNVCYSAQFVWQVNDNYKIIFYGWYLMYVNS